MRVLFDVSHPAHVHLFRHAVRALEDAGHDTLVTSREKDLTTQLLDAYGIDHTPLSAKGDSKLSLVTEWTGRELRMLRAVWSFDPDVVVSRLNPPAAHASFVLDRPNVVFDDSEAARGAARITHPFTDVICTPANYDRDLGPKQVRYDGFHELAYLHPNRFDPDPERLASHGVDADDRYAVVRFVSWGAHHDVGQRGLSDEAKRELIDRLSERGDVYITSESSLPSDLERYRLPVPPETIHDLLYHADLYVGDSQTMAAEAGVLGTPAIRSNSFVAGDDMSNFVELEQTYELLESIGDERTAVERATELFADPAATEAWQRKRDRLLADKVDVTSFMLDVVEQVARAN